MSILLIIAYLLLFLFLLYRLPFFRLEGLPRMTVPAVFLLKCAAGTALWYVYTFYYDDPAKADIYKYFNDSEVMYNALHTQPVDYFKMLFSIGNDNAHFDQYYSQMNNWYREFENNLYNDSHTMIRFNALLRLISFGNYHVHTIIMCFLSTTGLVALYKTFVRFLTGKAWWLALVVFGIPSVLFWGSGVLKEGLLFFALGLLVYFVLEWAHRRWWWPSVLVVLVCGALLAHLKFYVSMALFPGLLAYFWVARAHNKGAWWKYGTVLGAGTAFALLFHKFIPSFNLLELLVRKQKDFFGLAAFENAGSFIEIPHLEPHFWSFLKAAPQGFFNTLMRPHLLEANGMLMYMAAFENLMLVLLILLALVFIKPIKSIPLNPLLFCLVFVVILFVVVGWTTPVMGSIVRYKIPALPFLGIALLLIIDRTKINRLFRKG